MIGMILASLVPLFLAMVLGFVAGLTKDIDNRNIDSLNAPVMNFALPAALFMAMAQTPRDAMIGQANVALALVAAMLVVFAAVFVNQTRLFGTDRVSRSCLWRGHRGPLGCSSLFATACRPRRSVLRAL